MELLAYIEQDEDIEDLLYNSAIPLIPKTNSAILLLHAVKKCFEFNRRIQLGQLVVYWDKNVTREEREGHMLSCQFAIFLSELEDEIIKYVCSRLVFLPIDSLAPIQVNLAKEIIEKWKRLFGNNICTIPEEEVKNTYVAKNCTFFPLPPWIFFGTGDENFRQWGPNNEEDGTPQYMLLCNDYENDDLSDDEDTDSREWFTEKCKICGERIGDRRWAVRLPIIDGGWTGCYDKWECVRAENKAKKLGVDNLIDKYEDQLTETGLDF